MSRIKPPPVNTIDFETGSIERRPDYPPKPKSISIQRIGEKKPTFYAWGHPEGNNCDEATPRAIVRDIVRSGERMLFQNAKFDVDVMQTHWKVGPVSWDRIHDTLYLLFLDDPHQRELSLKPSAARLLDMPPDERDAVKDWILAHKKEIERIHGKFTPKEAGKHICMAPAQIVKPYCNGDVIRTKKLYDLLFPVIHECGMMEAYDRERQLMPILLENERQGVRIDIAALERDVEIYEKALKYADAWLRRRLGNKDLDFEKDREVAAALKKSGIVKHFVQTPTGQDSVSKRNLTPSMFEDPRVASVLGYRNRLVTCLNTFMRNWLSMASRNNGWLNTNWNQVRNTDGKGVGARTGRLSSSSPNFMNMPKAWDGKDDGYVHPSFLRSLPPLPILRRYILPDSNGALWLHRDYNQQELRILGHFEDGALKDEYISNPELDVHQYVKEQIWEITHLDVPRPKTKSLNFGMLYGMGLSALALALDTPYDEAKRLKKAQLAAMPGLKQLNDGILELANHDEPIRTWGGRLYYKEAGVKIRNRLVDFGYKLLNYLIQGSAADCTKQAIINYDAIKKHGRFLITVHDELNGSAPKKAAKSEMKLLNEAMLSVTFGVPMLSDAKMGTNWGTLEKYKEKR
jgi:DNA polymerase I-like protein with 3'-5' exonuclease and polymerase domains